MSTLFKKMILYLLLRIIVLSFLILLDRLYFWFALSMYLMHLWMNGKHSCDKNLRQGVSPTRSWTCVNLIGVLIKRSASFSLIEEIVPPCGIRYYTQLSWRRVYHWHLTFNNWFRNTQNFITCIQRYPKLHEIIKNNTI